MSEAPDVKVSRSDTYSEIYPTHQIAGLNYDGLKMTVFNDSPDLTDALATEHFKMSKLVINRRIECTLHLNPQALKDWALTLLANLRKYEGMFGSIMSPEEVQQKFKEYDSEQQ